MRLATGLQSHDPTRAALAEGRVHVEQAEAILRALTELPDDLDPDITLKAEQHLLELAADHDAKALKQLGRHILEVASPDAADAHEAKLLEREERDAAAATRLTMWDDGHGKVHGRFTLDALTGAMLKKALYAFAAPKHRASQGPLGERRPTPERLGHAFTELIQRYPTKTPPQSRRPQRHRRGPDAPRHPDGRTQGRPTRHRRNHLPRPGPPAGLRSPDHPRRPRRQIRSPRPRPRQTASTAKPNGSSRPSKPAAAQSTAATGHPA